MRLRDLLNKGKCFIGLHQGEWNLASPSECSFTRTCARCGVEQHRVEHMWGEWAFVTEASCDQLRTCQRCRVQEQRVTHAWGAPGYAGDGRCEQEQVCTRCSAVQPAPDKHVMDRWRYLDDGACTQVQQCSRCHSDGNKRRVEHRFGDWQYNATTNEPARVCLRCGEMQVKPLSEAPAPPAFPRISSGKSTPDTDLRSARSFDDDVTMVAGWYNVNQEERLTALRAHLADQTPKTFQVFRSHVSQMEDNTAATIRQHEANEDNAWGQYAEDRISYRLARLQTGQRDPAFLERLRELQGYAALYQWVAKESDLIWKERGRPSS